MSVRVRVIKYDGTCEDWGNVIGLNYGAADEVVSIRHHDGSRVRTKDYYCGHYKDVEVHSASADYDTFPADAAIERSS